MKKNLLKSSFVFSAMTLVSRVTGFLRELVFAHFFGASAGFDAYLIAYRIPNFLRRLFAEGAFSQAFVPILSEYRQKQDESDTREFLDHIAGLMITVLFVVTVIAILITPWLVYIFAPGYINDATQMGLVASMLKITFPYILFISLAAYVSGILNTYGNFGVPAFAPNMLNLALIAASIFVAPHMAEPVKALAWGIFIGGAAQLLIQLPSLYKLGLMPRPSVLWKDAGVRRVLKLMAPAVLGVSVAPLGVLIDTWLATFLQTGSISWLYFSDRLTSFPMGIFGVAIATVVLPYLSRKHASGSQEEFSKALEWGLRFVLIIAIPSTIALIILAGPILATLFLHGKFSEFDVVMASYSVIGFAIGIPNFMLVKLFASGFYSRQNIKTPVKIAIISVLSNVLLAVILLFPLKHAGLALSTSLTSGLNAFLLYREMRKNNYYRPGASWTAFLLRLGFATLVMGGVLLAITADLSIWLGWGHIDQVWHLGAICAAAAVAYFLSLHLVGIKWREFVFYDR